MITDHKSLCFGLKVSGGLVLLWLGSKLVNKVRRRTDIGKSPKSVMEKKAVFISGCDSGFGFSLAIHCQTVFGYQVIAGCLSPDDPSSGAKKLQNSGVKVVHLDVTKDESIKAMVEETKSFLQANDLKLWCVVNNAAVLVFADAEFQTRSMIQHQFDVNVIGALEVTKAFLPMLRTTHGRIVNMLSFCTTCPLPTLSVYTSTKGALRSLSIGMRMELSKFNVDVILFNPGDHPGETPLCSNQDAHYNEMMNEVRAKADFELFQSYFEDCRKKFSNLFNPPREIKELNDSGLYSTFNEILTVTRPKPEYVNSDFGTIGFYNFLQLIPTSWADKIRIGIMKLPKL